MEEFGHNTFILNGIPLGFEEQDIQQSIEQILEAYKNNLAHSFARSMGRKRNKVFSEEEMQSLLRELFSTSSPHVSPSGKKICITFNEMELKRMFQ
jgi:DNA mismatch repair protein MutL